MAKARVDLHSIEEVLRLHHECGCSQRESARSWGLSVGAVNKLLCVAAAAKSHAGAGSSQHPHGWAFYAAFAPARARELVRRIEFCYTPKHGGWLNIAECELGAMTARAWPAAASGDLVPLRAEIAAWSSDVNPRQRGVDWHMKVDDARCKLKSVYPKIIL